MTRAERRRQDRELTKSQTTYTLTNAQIEVIKKQAVEDAMRIAFRVFLGLSIKTLMDKWGFGKKRLQRFTDFVMNDLEAYEDGIISFDDVHTLIEEEVGVRILDKPTKRKL